MGTRGPGVRLPTALADIEQGDRIASLLDASGPFVPCPPGFSLKKRLENQRSRHLVDHPPMVLSSVPGFIENLVRLPGRQPLVPKVDREPGQLPQCGRKRLRLFCLAARFPRQVHRIAHHDTHYPKPPRQPGQRPHVFPRTVFPLQRQHRLRRKPQLIGHSHANAPVADIQSEIARLSFQAVLPRCA
jgi:hypothetical protein